MKTFFKNICATSLLLTVTALLFSGSVQAQDNSTTEAQGKTVYEVVNNKDDVSEFATLLEESGYAAILKQEGSYTVLAPSNEAVQKTDAELKESPKELMKGQLFKGEVPKDQVESQMGVTVQETDESASNGVVYVVDQVVTQ
jgi:uncharacterized surface protein with fasciclin (FAS1) repeats